MTNADNFKKSIHAHKKRAIGLKNHPFIVPVVAFFILFFVSLGAYVTLFNSTTIGPDDARVVHVFVDESEQTLPTRARTVEELLKRMNIEVKPDDVVEPSLDAVITQDDFYVNIYRAREVTIIDKSEKKTLNTADQSPRIVARKAGIVVFPEDNIVPVLSNDILNEGLQSEQYEIDRATPVTLILYGSLTPIRTQANTVEELLEEKDIDVAPEDNLKPSPASKLKAGQQVFITRPGQRIATKEESIDFKTEYVDDPKLVQGVNEVREEGQKGRKVTTYDVLTENGKVVSRRKIQEIVVIQPQRKLVARGTKVVISNPSSNVKLGEKLAASRGWTGQQFYCLYQLWQRESGWSATAGNPSTGAYGIPQALPGSKMSTYGSDWLTNPEPQIKWGLNYVAGRYGTPCGAWSTFQSRGWY